jgi:predicted ATP-grasp superfamily ATP-dependent carboligase
LTLPPLACVLGDIDLVRPLGMAGIRCAVVARPTGLARHSRFTEIVIEWADPWSDPGTLLARLLAFGSSQDAAPVLFYQDDWDLLLVSRNRAALAERFRFVMPDAELVEDLVDKARFQRLAERLDLPVPPARWLRIDDDRGSLVDVPLPAIVKPLTRQAATWGSVGGGAKAISVSTPHELESVVARLHEAGVDALVQQLIPGPESRMESYHVYVDAAGQVRGEFTGRKLRTWPRAYGHTSALEITDAPEVRATGRAIIETLDLRGVAKCDFKRDPDGRLHLLEINPRFNLWHHPGASAGVNIPAIVYHDLVGRQLPVGSARPGTRWVHPTRDVLASLQGRSMTPGWLRWALESEAKSGVAKDDWRPLTIGGMERGASAVRRVIGSALGPHAYRGTHRAPRGPV